MVVHCSHAKDPPARPLADGGRMQLSGVRMSDTMCVHAHRSAAIAEVEQRMRYSLQDGKKHYGRLLDARWAGFDGGGLWRIMQQWEHLRAVARFVGRGLPE
jgi:hypothetical protein